MPTTPDGLPYPTGTDLTDVPGDIQALADGVDGKYVPKALVDAKGDLLVASGPDAVIRQAVGADKTVLTADPSQSGGLGYKTLQALLLDSGVRQVVTKFTTESVASSAVAQGDDELFFTVGSSGRYVVELNLMYKAGTTGGLRFRWFASGSLFSGWHGVAGDVIGVSSAPYGTALDIAGNALDQRLAKIWAYFHVSAAGTMTFLWAQATSNTTATSVIGGSTMTVWKS